MTEEETISSSASKIINTADDERQIHLTEAQKKFLKRRSEVESRVLKSITAKTYRDRVEEFNQKLSTMTEHNDIPRVSAAGNG